MIPAPADSDSPAARSPDVCASPQRLLHRIRSGRDRSRALLVALAIGLAAWFLKPTHLIDTVWSDLLLASQRTAASSRIVLVRITSRDLLAYGQDRLSRMRIAKMLDVLETGGVQRILIDYNLGGELLADEKSALLTITNRLGPDKLASAYEPDAELRAAPALLANMTVVELRLIAEADGRYRRLRGPQGSQLPDPARWLAFGEKAPGETPFDLRIDPAKFACFSLGELLAPDFSSDSLRGKLAIVALDRTAARTRANLPLHGAVDRGSLLAIAAQSQLDGHARLAWRATLASLAICLVALGAGFSIGVRSPTIARASFWFLLLGISLFFVSWLCVRHLGMRSEPAKASFIAMTGMYTAIAFRLGLVDLLAGFFAGNLSPEEVWLWRTRAESSEPAVLFDASGGIKRANFQALEAFGLDAASLRAPSQPLALRCMPNLGRRIRQFTNERDGRKWQVDWPHESLPLAVFTDVTLSVEQRETLQKRLVTDPLTGLFNRTGFDERLTKIVERGSANYAVLFMDMNGFKEVNDVHGHDAGDALLKAAAARFQSALRPGDLLARMGGDEFAIIVEGAVTPESLTHLRTRLEATLVAPIDLGTTTVKVGVAVGFSIAVGPDDGAAEVLKRADAAMYARKAEIKRPAAVAAAVTATVSA